MNLIKKETLDDVWRIAQLYRDFEKNVNDNSTRKNRHKVRKFYISELVNELSDLQNELSDPAYGVASIAIKLAEAGDWGLLNDLMKILKVLSYA